MKESTLTKRQATTLTKKIRNGKGHINVKIRYDDNCGNGHNSFSITGDIFNSPTSELDRYHEMGGCIHEEIIKYFPKLKKYIKWHLTSSDGPMHYLSNTLYNAGDKDHNGYHKGQVDSWEKKIKFGNFPILFSVNRDFQKWLEEVKAEGSNYDFEVIGIDHKDRKTYGTHYTFGGFGETWYDCPFQTEEEAVSFLAALQSFDFKTVEVATSRSDGKERELDAARNSAVWPEATDKCLMSDNLKEALEARLPSLMNEFRRDMEELDFIF